MRWLWLIATGAVFLSCGSKPDVLFSKIFATNPADVVELRQAGTRTPASQGNRQCLWFCAPQGVTLREPERYLDLDGSAANNAIARARQLCPEAAVLQRSGLRTRLDDRSRHSGESFFVDRSILVHDPATSCFVWAHFAGD